jgi:hypothetical protein
VYQAIRFLQYIQGYYNKKDTIHLHSIHGMKMAGEGCGFRIFAHIQDLSFVTVNYVVSALLNINRA